MTVQIKVVGNVTFISGPAASGKSTRMLELVRTELEAGKTVKVLGGRSSLPLLDTISKTPDEVIAVDDFPWNAENLEGISKTLEKRFPDKQFLITL